MSGGIQEGIKQMTSNDTSTQWWTREANRPLLEAFVSKEFELMRRAGIQPGVSVDEIADKIQAGNVCEIEESHLLEFTSFSGVK